MNFPIYKSKHPNPDAILLFEKLLKSHWYQYNSDEGGYVRHLFKDGQTIALDMYLSKRINIWSSIKLIKSGKFYPKTKSRTNSLKFDLKVGNDSFLNAVFSAEEGLYVINKISFVDDEISQAGFDNGTVEENDDRRWHLRKERSSKFRQFATDVHGKICQACDVDYSHVYGDLWNGFVEAHHLFPRSEIKEPKKTDVRKEACVLCANCHRMIHRWMSSEGVKGRFEYNRNDLLNFRKEIIKSDAK